MNAGQIRGRGCHECEKLRSRPGFIPASRAAASAIEPGAQRMGAAGLVSWQAGFGACGLKS